MTPSRPSVILRHTVPGARAHHDWMFLLLSDPERALLTVRVDGRPDHLSEGETLCGTLLPPHRTVYLTYEGPLSGGRGAVTRVACGNMMHADDPALLQPGDSPDAPPTRQTSRPAFTVTIAWEGSAAPHAYALQPNGHRDDRGHPEITICRIPSPH